METASETSAPAAFDPAAGGVGGSIRQAVDAAIPGLAAGAGEITVGPVALSRAPAARGRQWVTARRLASGGVVAVDTVDLARAGQRRRSVQQAPEKLVADPRPIRSEPAWASAPPPTGSASPGPPTVGHPGLIAARLVADSRPVESGRDRSAGRHLAAGSARGPAGCGRATIMGAARGRRSCDRR